MVNQLSSTKINVLPQMLNANVPDTLLSWELQLKLTIVNSTRLLLPLLIQSTLQILELTWTVTSTIIKIWANTA